jgi:Na+/H+ antiporter NhaD/arsenite permease-like protein
MSANLGGNTTPIGSVSSVIALHALHDSGSGKIGWGEFLAVGGLVTALQIAVVLAYLLALTALDLFPALPPP